MAIESIRSSFRSVRGCAGVVVAIADAGDFWMVGLQLAGPSCLFLAAWRLRPTFRRQEDTRPTDLVWRRACDASPPSLFSRADCGADASFGRSVISRRRHLHEAGALAGDVIVTCPGFHRGKGD